MTPRQWVWWLESVPFTAAAIRGETSLGGSESAALGMMRALVARGHDVQCFATRLETPGEYDGVTWHRAETDFGAAMGFLTPDVFVSLRMPTPFVHARVNASLNVLWAEDLLIDPSVVATLAQVDQLWFVSDYHRKQWCDKEPLVAPLAWVTRNGIDPTIYPALVGPGFASFRDGVRVSKDRAPHRYIYASRPERALKPLLALWADIRKADPEAVLGICRYRSMYDGEGTAVQRMVDQYDDLAGVAARDVGGIEWLGHLTKRQLAEAIAQSRAMLYPGVADFAETSGIVALEAQACGTPLIGSWRGALPETLHPEAGILIDGDPETPEYRAAYLEAVRAVASMDDAAYGRMQTAGRAHVQGYAFDIIAATWEARVEDSFRARYAAHKPAILRNLLHWDRHVMGLPVAQEIVANHEDHVSIARPETAVPSKATLDASFARDICIGAIRGEGSTAEDYATHAIQDPIAERDTSDRYPAMIEAAKGAGATGPRAILDVASGNGSLALALAAAFPEAHVRGIDYSPGVLKLAEGGAATAGVSDRVTFEQSGWQDLPVGPFDLVVCGEFLEHVEEPHALINALEAACKPGGVCVLSTPCGPFAELLDDPENRKRGHLHAFTHQQLTRLFTGRQWTLRHQAIGLSRRGTSLGYWIVAWTPNTAEPSQPLDWEADIVATRPYQGVAAILIVKDAQEHIIKCLTSFRGAVDRILVHDTGSTDATRHLCESYGATVIATNWPGSFAVARNRVLAEAEAGGADWVLWIDADEYLEHPERLRRYTTGAGPFVGYVIRQNHLMLDQPVFHDKPVRLFRTGHGIRFFGFVHEQPETAPDAGVWPSLEAPDLDIVHLGYTRDAERRRKLLARNLPLLKLQLQAPEGERRRLDGVLFIRDCANIAQFATEANRGRPDKRAMQHADAGRRAYQQHFAEATDKYHGLARPFYETCLAILGEGFEVAWALGAGAPSVKGRLNPEKFRVASVEEARIELEARSRGILAQMAPVDVDTRPSVVRMGHRLAE